MSFDSKTVDIKTPKRLKINPVNWRLNPLANYAGRSLSGSGIETYYFPLFTEFESLHVAATDETIMSPLIWSRQYLCG